MITIRCALKKDMQELVNIYSYYVENTAITFEYEVPSVEEFTNRYQNVIKKYPKLRISIAHIGGFQYEELIDLGLFFNISAILPDLVDKYGIEEANKILRKLDVEKLIFATDYPDNRKLEPSKIYDKYFEILSKMDFSEEEAEKICRLNALEMINKYSQKTS